ncbi:tRNA (adenosine(37)-N6)-threonylcarbamoyltransferase complex ATPase subunit type 1 TsaE [Limnobacter humi]|uniref:tRNA threonylcarbamoyladenosine biosynthesis protein TsaE n=1 Tax=Limnobacter humi TaxID=1778671 RepID=A0ABT1WBI1_9BURK|nr:tRNA (adenosine(37)-N6)-threonylcarbamoyltransferase complex ATPase subunit type 1 TsaE [Limnobacter humi]MCQ8894873.1 tRNA (adenosine(37)-N6)-threonylcarbamoyltransferase complex ATPase subunit type 1 TsaE [Limnobacter humi]
MKTIRIECPNEAATRSVGEKLAQHACAPLCITLSGPLGAGKSALVRAYLRALGVTGPIKSPSYALVEPYNLSNYSVYHFDFYRFFDQNEWVESGFRDYFDEQAVCLVEWPEKAAGLLPLADLAFELAYGSMTGPAPTPADGFPASPDEPTTVRIMTVTAHTERGKQVLDHLI